MSKGHEKQKMMVDHILKKGSSLEIIVDTATIDDPKSDAQTLSAKMVIYVQKILIH